jgi:hypothetical protein
MRVSLGIGDIAVKPFPQHLNTDSENILNTFKAADSLQKEGR